MLFKHPLSGLQVQKQYSASQVTAMKKKSAKVCLITEVNGCLQESDGLFHLQSVFKVAKEATCGQTDGVCCKTRERPSGVNHHAFQCMFTLFTVFLWYAIYEKL